jgi:CRISPR/Cas system CSM-associated protein Csm3 (group 7 of RAMP superfamily)
MIPICKELREFTGIGSDISFYQMITRMFQTRRDELRTQSKEGEDDEEKIQMIVEYECFAPGTRFYHEIILETTGENEELDLSTLYRAVELWQERPFVGGKSSVGFGKLKIEYRWPKQVDSNTYVQFIEKNKDEIHKVLNELAEVL